MVLIGIVDYELLYHATEVVFGLQSPSSLSHLGSAGEWELWELWDLCIHVFGDWLLLYTLYWRSVSCFMWSGALDS